MVVLIGGGSCSGKTTLAKTFVGATVVEMDDFYKGKSQMSPPYNFDEPAALDLVGLTQAVECLVRGERAEVPHYDMKVSEPRGTHWLEPADLIVVEGIFVLHHEPLRQLADMCVYIDVPAAERVRRRIMRDTIKGRDTLATLEHSHTVEDMHMKWVEPTKQYAHWVIPFIQHA